MAGIGRSSWGPCIRATLAAALTAASVAPALAQLVVHQTAGPPMAEDIAGPSDSPLEQQRQAMIAALQKSPFELPVQAEVMVTTGDTTPLLLAGLEAARGVHVARNYGLAMQLLQRAAAQYDPRAITAMAVMQANGWGVPRDLAHARGMLQALEQVGFGRAYCVQAELDARLPGGAQLRRNKALIAEGARLGDAYCQNMLGATLELDGDFDAAQQAYEAAAAQASATAQRNLARLAQRSQGQQNSLLELQERAEAGNPQAQFDLARRLHRGIGVPRDYAAALKWYGEAAKQLPQAREVLQVILQQNADPNHLDPLVMQRLSNLPVVADVAMPVMVRSPLRDPDALAGLEFLSAQPWARRLSERAHGGPAAVAGAAQATADQGGQP